MPHQVYALLVEVFRLTVWLALLAAVFVPLERLFAVRPQKILRKRLAQDLGLYFLSSLAPGFLISLPLALLSASLHRILPASYYAAAAQLPLWSRLLLAFVIGDIGFYWAHRWTHEIPLLWRFHAVHHQAEDMDWLVNTRAHPVDIVFVRLVGLAPIYILGLAQPGGGVNNVAPVLVVLLGTLWGFLIHSNIRWRMTWLEPIVATPRFHHWHHTLSGPINRNFASMLPALDRIFGTLHLPHQEWPQAYGVEAGGQSEGEGQPNGAVASAIST
jgi:sterol desaturase/sphingolipid hydroxylase (fatty acid hydroxylase superfamily)